MKPEYHDGQEAHSERHPRRNTSENHHPANHPKILSSPLTHLKTAKPHKQNHL